jgi:cytochrome c
MTPAPVTVQAVEPVPAAKPAPVVQEKPAAVKETPAAALVVKPAPAQVITPAAKVEPAPAVAAPAKVVLSEVDALGLAKKNGCLVCHAIDKKVVGPAWKDVAAKYRGDAGAEARLMDKIAKGGSGVWGGIAMPPNAKLGEADRQALARFVLSLK